MKPKKRKKPMSDVVLAEGPPGFEKATLVTNTGTQMAYVNGVALFPGTSTVVATDAGKLKLRRRDPN